MFETNESYRLLIEKLDQFTRKFYINRLLRGSLYFTGLTLGLFLAYNLLEYYFYFGTGIRKFFFYSFILIAAGSFIYWIGDPLLRYFKLGKQISREQAAAIIGQHFEDVQDKLLNILQLSGSAEMSSSKALIEASIAQKSDEIRPVPFSSAIDLSGNRKYVKYALPPLLLLLAFLVMAPNLITEPTERIIRNNEYFEKEAPFQFNVMNSDLNAPQYEDFDLKVSVEGEQLPSEVVIDINGFPYTMRSNGDGTFSHRFNNVQDDLDFFLRSGEVRSESYLLNVLEKPVIDGFSVRLDYPSYTGKRDETLQNIGDLVVPAGTKVQWALQTRFTDSLSFNLSGIDNVAKQKNSDNYLYTSTLYKNTAYTIRLSNEETGQYDSVRYIANVVPDKYPAIELVQEIDTVTERLIYFAGNASDDYGLSKLEFKYRIIHEDGTEEPVSSSGIPVNKSSSSNYQYVWDLNQIKLNAGDELRYYFEVWDNDGVNGPKSTRSGIQRFALPSLEELEEQTEESNKAIKESLKKSTQENKKLREEIRKLREKLLQEKELDWQSRKDIERLLDKQSEIQKNMDKAREELKENLKNQRELDSDIPENLQDKQEKLEELFEQSENKEMEELMEQIQEMLQELNKDQSIQMLEQFEQQQMQSEQSMERMQELFKQLEVELEAQRQVEKLQELAEQQEQLSEESLKEENSSDSLAMEQEKLNDAFEELQEKMEELMEKNEELQRPKDIDEEQMEEEMEDIEEDMENSSDELQQDNKQKASDSQKKASQKMKKMANQLQSSMQSSDMEQASEDIEALRQLLENLVTMSFDQEDLVNDFNAVRVNTPDYVSLIQDQYKLKGDFELIEDSLNALSKRVFQIEAFVTEKVYEVNENLEQSLIQLTDRKKSQASEYQRRTMKNVNDLALMLSEAMEQMQQNMSSMMPGNQMCSKPGGTGQGKSNKNQQSPVDKITEGQKKLGEQLQQMQQQAKDGKQNSSKDFAKAAAQQAALRKMLRDLQKEKQERGQGDPLLQQIMEEMDKMETDLVNKRLTNEMLRRQEEIKTRLLEAEQAEREREWDNKRKSKTAEEIERKFPPALEEYIKQRESETQFYKPVSPELLPFYKTLVDSYYNELKKKS